MYGDAGRLFFWSGLVFHAGVRAYWVSLVVRLTIDLELPSLQLMLMGTGMELAVLLAEVPTGVLADRFSRKWSVVIGFVVVGVAQVAAGLVAAFPALVATQVLWGVGYTFRSGADTAWVTDELGGAASVQALLLRRGRWQLAVSVAAIGAGAGLARLTSLSTAVVVAGGLLVATGAALALLMPEHHGPRSRQRDRPAAGAGAGPLAILVAGSRVVRGSRSLRVLVVALFVAGLGGEAVDRLDIRRLDDLGLSARYDEVVLVGVIAAVEALAGAAVLWWVGRRAGGPRVAAGVAALLGLGAVGIAVLGLVAVLPVAVAALVFQGGLRSALHPLELAWANAEAPSEVRATVHSVVEQATSLGEIGGGILLGAVAALTTVPTALGCSAGLLLVAAVSASRARNLGPSAPASPPAPVPGPVPSVTPTA